jgi:predicted chitinase
MIQLTAEALRAIYPKAPQAVIDSFLSPAGQAALDAAGITATRTRLSIALSQAEHETAGFTIPNLTESIAYTPARATQVWPSRFKTVDQVYAKVGSSPAEPLATFRRKLMNYVYGARMGNRPGTDDGFDFIGRGAPQITGHDGYAEVGKRAGLPLVDNPALACAPANQAIILAAFWTWKNLNPKADTGGLKATTVPWNGGLIGEADREAKMAGNDPIIARLATADRVMAVAKTLPGVPPTPAPPPEVIADATVDERKARTIGVASAGTGAAGEASKASTTVPADHPIVSPLITYSLIGLGVAVVIGAAILIARKKAAVAANWF